MTSERKRILIMDDEAYIRELLEDMIGMLGYSTVTTSEGQEAIKVFEQALNSGKRFDAIVMDLTIPCGMGGKEAIEEILKIDPDARSIVASGYSADNIMANYGAFGFTTILQKPFRFDEINKALEEVMQ